MLSNPLLLVVGECVGVCELGGGRELGGWGTEGGRRRGFQLHDNIIIIDLLTKFVSICIHVGVEGRVEAFLNLKY